MARLDDKVEVCEFTDEVRCNHCEAVLTEGEHRRERGGDRRLYCNPFCAGLNGVKESDRVIIKYVGD